MTRAFELQCWVKKFYRQGIRFQKHLKELEKTGRYDQVALQDLQNRRLQNMIRHCAENVPYYQDLFRELKLKPDDILSPADLVKLPILDKQTVNQNFDKLIVKNRRNFLCQLAKTSGTTGSPGKFWRDYNSINLENAAVWRQWHNSGDFGKRRISFRGQIVCPSSVMEPPFWRYNPANREIQMSSFHLSLKNSKAYIDEILKFQPKVLYCLPSVGALLGRFFRHYGIDYQFEHIFTSSESVEPETLRFLEETFQAKVVDWYGQTERIAAIAHCEMGSYHIVEDYSIVELLPAPAEMQPDHEQQEIYEVVGTHLHNFVMPLLRYRTKDYVTVTEQEKLPCACGSKFRRLEKIVGRSEQPAIITPEGVHIIITAHISMGIDHLLETQCIQEKPGEMLVKIVTSAEFSEENRRQLLENAVKFTSPSMKVEIQKVDEIPRGPNGKFIGVINTMGVERQASPV